MEVKDVLGNLMHVAEENPEMTEKMMYKTCVQFFTDGYETAASAMTVLMYYLAVNPEIQTRCQDEIDDLFEKKNEDEDRHIDEKDLLDMPYIEQVI